MCNFILSFYWSIVALDFPRHPNHQSAVSKLWVDLVGEWRLDHVFDLVIGRENSHLRGRLLGFSVSVKSHITYEYGKILAIYDM